MTLCALAKAVAAALCAVFVALAPWPHAQAQSPAKRYVLKVSYQVGNRVLEDEFTVTLGERTIQFSCDAFDEDKGPIVPRAGGSDVYTDNPSKDRKRTCQISVRRNPNQSLFFDTLKTTDDRDQNTPQPVIHRDRISFLLSFTGTGCQLSSITYVYNDEKPYRIASSSCR